MVLLNRTHGMTKTRAYKIWSSIVERTNPASAEKFPSHAGRGIKLSPLWANFENFLADMGHPPPGKSIDRINNDGNYEPGNCRWATPKEQAHNRRTNKWAICDGATLLFSEAANHYGVSKSTISRWVAAGRIVEVKNARSEDKTDQK